MTTDDVEMAEDAETQPIP